MPEIGDPEYEHKEVEAKNLIRAAVLDTTQFSGGTWKDEIAGERFKQWEWFYSEVNKPKPVNLSESTLHHIYKEYLKERGYSASKLPANKGKKAPDFLVEGGPIQFLNEFKAPELIFNKELNVYKFQTTHSKILTFISKAVKQLQAEDSGHEMPWIVTFASTHSQLNWKSFVDTMQGGVAYDSRLSPDFTDTDVFKRVITKAKEIDLYIWLQVSPTNESFYQVSFIVKENSRFLDPVKQFVAAMKAKDISSMDNVISLDWPFA